VSLTSTFFSLIPHSFGRSVPPVIDSPAKLKDKLDMVQVSPAAPYTAQHRMSAGHARLNANRQAALEPARELLSCCIAVYALVRRWETWRLP